jgi:ring-1,2-phenylacetyl-CoA epoxidase subunit PaaD
MVMAMSDALSPEQQKIYDLLRQVKDPEIPVLSVVDMGIITAVDVRPAPLPVLVTMTPTFVGCPAIDIMKKNIVGELAASGLSAEVKVDFETKWTSDRMTSEAKDKLEKFGLAPPPLTTDEDLTEEQLNNVRCPLLPQHRYYTPLRFWLHTVPRHSVLLPLQTRLRAV